MIKEDKHIILKRSTRFLVNTLDSHMTKQQKEMACKILDAFKLDKFKVIAKDQYLHFIQDRRVVHIPLSLISKEKWADIRFLFRSILQSGPSVWNQENPHMPFESYLKE